MILTVKKGKLAGKKKIKLKTKETNLLYCVLKFTLDSESYVAHRRLLRHRFFIYFFASSSGTVCPRFLLSIIYLTYPIVPRQ